MQEDREVQEAGEAQEVVMHEVVVQLAPGMLSHNDTDTQQVLSCSIAGVSGLAYQRTYYGKTLIRSEPCINVYMYRS